MIRITLLCCAFGLRRRWRSQAASLPLPARMVGFTLIELSIVLIVIGLIVGSVLVGQDLIESAQLRSQTSQIQEIQTVINVFKLKYNALPGDMPNATLFWPSTLNGDGNKLMRWALPSSPTTQQREDLLFWQHLGMAELIKGHYIGPQGARNGRLDRIVFGENALAGRFPGAGFKIESGTNNSNSPTRNALILASGSPLSNSTIHGQIWGRNDHFVVTARQAANIDRKIDNGRNGSGRIEAYTRVGTTSECPSGSVSNSGYIVRHPNKCYVLFYFFEH